MSEFVCIRLRSVQLRSYTFTRNGSPRYPNNLNRLVTIKILSKIHIVQIFFPVYPIKFKVFIVLDIIKNYYKGNKLSVRQLQSTLLTIRNVSYM